MIGKVVIESQSQRRVIERALRLHQARILDAKRAALLR